MSDTAYTVGDYLRHRLAEAGVDRVFGVPGDYSLALLDYLTGQPDMAWTGCTNELNAGYAADGYARMRGIGALCTTFGVGELSAINAVAGSFAEHVPVVHIVGSPPLGTQAAARIVHHSLGDGVFTHFAEMHQKITCAQAALTAATACAEIDRVLSAVRTRRLPGYLLIPADVAVAPAAPPTGPLPAPAEDADPEAVAGFTAAARRLLATASAGRYRGAERAADPPLRRGRRPGRPARGRPCRTRQRCGARAWSMRPIPASRGSTPGRRARTPGPAARSRKRPC